MKRYHVGTHEMQERPDGEYALYADLQTEHDRVRTVLDKLHSEVKDEYDDNHPLMVMVRSALAGEGEEK